MKSKCLMPFLVVIIVGSGCKKPLSEVSEEARLPSAAGKETSPRSEALQPRTVPPPATGTSIESSADQVKVHLDDPTQEEEMRQLLGRISDAQITKFHITSLESGTFREVVGFDEKRLLAWNSAGRRLYSSVEEAQKDGYAVWEFGPDSEAVRMLDEIMRKEGERGYSDDLLLILWDGLEFAVSQ
jgi:hypothetical protein